MAGKDARRHPRLPYSGPVRLGWEDPAYGTRYAQGKCIDVSERGLRVEVPVPIPPRTAVSISADRIHVTGSASVKHAVRFGAKYLVGLELNSTLPPKAIDTIRGPWALRSGTSV
jgi:hypothetical protein